MTLKTLLIASVLMAAPLSAQTRQLFNGKNLEGWAFLPPDEKGFAVNNGLLETTTGKGMLWYTKEKIGNETIKVVYKMASEMGNSAIFIRIPVEPKSEGDGSNKGIEEQIDNRDNDCPCTAV